MLRQVAIASAVGAVIVGLTPPVSSARTARYCERPGGPGNFLAATSDVTCATAKMIASKLYSAACRDRNRCTVDGFSCIAYWDGRFDRSFSFTNHGVCHDGRRWIEFDLG
jgi:hypothetical protein